MSDKFYRLPIERLFKWILEEEKEGRIFGLYKELLFKPDANDPFRMRRYGRMLETPIGVAAGPHTQLAHNIIASWLCGARYIELKTVQTLDEIQVTKPCIDMEDEGYNCEWSQELKIKDSFDEYLNAWIIIHVLKHKFGWDESEPGFIFNMSVGYDYKGILCSNVQWFLDRMNNCADELNEKIRRLKAMYPEIESIKIPSQISDNITLSTMHGCPPEEIAKIGSYLIKERKLHTAIKLNPTLLGPELLRNILNEKLGYEINVPDEAFEHDLKYKDALEIIKSLSQLAKENGVQFGLKLTNTLESLNLTKWLPGSEKMVYTSGRALHPISINLAEKLQTDFNGTLDLSFSAGVDAFNVSAALKCNLKPITVCSDLLKPGGYLRLTQYLEELAKEFSNTNSKTVNEFIAAGNSNKLNVQTAGLFNLKSYAKAVLENKAYYKSNFPYENIKTKRALTAYDCIHAPCIDTCAVSQNVPEYMYYTGKEEFEKAHDVILQDNPLPNITGNVCDHLCQPKCTRINYDNPLLIRGIKRFVSEQFNSNGNYLPDEKKQIKAAVIGAGPSGLSCAYFLARGGFDVDVFEGKSFAGGMASDSIPNFRLSSKSIENDFNIIKSAGIKLHFNKKVDEAFFEELKRDYKFIYIGIGAQKSKRLGIPGEELNGVLDQLEFLSKVRKGEEFKIGKNVAVIGGGNSAIDAARTANRLIDISGKVTVVYRRTRKEMPADREEINALLEEGINLLELTAPVSISNSASKLLLKCIKIKLSGKDDSGRRKPVPISGSEFELAFDNIITAIGQEIALDFIPGNQLIINPETNETQIPNVYAGGDAVRGADSLINAMGDGRKVAEYIIKQTIKSRQSKHANALLKLSPVEFQKKQAYREFGTALPETSLDERKSFKLVHPVLDEASAVKEAQRCMFCDDLCNICVGVCPNFANLSFEAELIDLPVYQLNGNNHTIRKVGKFFVQQKNQIINISDFCNECGNCNTFCPTSGAPYKTKPRFHLTGESFDAEDSGYYFSDGKLIYKMGGRREILFFKGEKIIYESPEVIINFNSKDFSIEEFSFKTKTVSEIELHHAPEMYYLYRSLINNPVFVR